MENVLKIFGKKFINHIRKTWRNKLGALALLVPTFLMGLWTGDGGPFMFTLLIIGMPLIFSKEDIFED